MNAVASTSSGTPFVTAGGPTDEADGPASSTNQPTPSPAGESVPGAELAGTRP